MDPAPRSTEEPTLRIVLIALAVTLGAQILAAFAVHSPAVFGPVATRDLGIAADRVGLYITISYIAAMTVGLITPSIIARYGPLRALQGATLVIGIGVAIAALGTVWAVIASAIVTGIGNAFMGPVSAQILAERSLAGRMSLIFSIKQTGVPVGAALAGALVPTAILLIGWRPTLVVGAALFVVAAVMVQPLRAEYDRGRDATVRLTWAGALAQMRESIAYSWRDARLRKLSIAAFAYVAMQVVLMTYVVSYLNLQLGYSLVLAGFLFSAMTVAGIVGRVFWGALADTMRRPQRLLGALGVAAALTACVLALATETWPQSLVALAAMAFGFTGVSWNGVYFAEVARNVPRAEVSRAMSGGMFFSFLGGIVGPLLFVFALPPGTRYSVGFVTIAVLSLLSGAWLMVRAPTVRLKTESR